MVLKIINHFSTLSVSFSNRRTLSRPVQDLAETAWHLSRNKIVSSQDSSFATLSEYFFSCVCLLKRRGSSPCPFFLSVSLFLFFVSFFFFLII